MKTLGYYSVLFAATVVATAAGSAHQSAEEELQLGNYSLPVTTSSARAQTLFDLGLMHEFGFNQAESRKAFQLAAKEDPSFAMAQWGLSYAWGGFLNHPALDASQANQSFVASRRAQDLCKGEPRQQRVEVERRLWTAACSPFEAALIEATVLRFPSPSSSRNQTVANVEYAEALQTLVDSGDDFGGTKYETALRVFLAEALMDLESNDYYSTEVCV